VCDLVGDSINPQLTPTETFAHYSIPAYDAGKAPALELGKSILSNKISFPRGAVLFSKLNPRISRVWHVDDSVPYRRICSTEFLPLVTRSAHALPAYVALVLQEPEIIGRLRAKVAAATKSRERLGPALVLDAEIPLPALDQQRRLVMLFMDQMVAVKRARAAAEAQLEAAKALHAAYRRAAFTSAEAQRWARVRLGDFLLEPLRTGISKPARPGADKECLTLSAIRGGFLELSAKKAVGVTDEEANSAWVRAGAFYVVRGNGRLSLVGRGALAPPVMSVPVLYPDLLIQVISDTQAITPGYLRHVWESEEVRADVERRARTSAGIFKINQANLAEVRVPLPDRAEQERVATQLDRQLGESDQVRKVLAERLSAINNAPAALLRRAFSGDL
jgi:type I restriction enzyme S subunit